MSSTHLSLHYHIVFGTKNHEPIIQAAWRGKLHAYLGGIIRTADRIAESIGGASDHVHLLIGLRATHRLADVLRELKAVSSGSKSTIAHARFAMSIWTYCGAAAWNLMSVMSDSLAPAGAW